MLLRTIIIIIQILLIQNSLAVQKINAECSPSKVYINDYEPANFITNNNLTRKEHKSTKLQGEKIILSGKVIDQDCNPVSDAKVYLWQVYSNGKYTYEPLRNNIDLTMIDTKSNHSFTGNGIFTTDNFGDFHFISILPKGVDDLPAHFNVRVEHHRLGSIQTKIYAKNSLVKDMQKPDDISDKIFNKAVSSKLKLFHDYIVLPG